MTKIFKFEPLSKKHDRETFDCGEESLNAFLERYAGQNERKGLSRTFVAVKDDSPKIYGYYSLSGGSVEFGLINDNLPRYPVPVIHLGRLAVDVSAQGQHLGQMLLAHAFKRSLILSRHIGIYAVEVYALNEQARRFYLRFGLTELKDDKQHLYITVKDLAKLVR